MVGRDGWISSLVVRVGKLVFAKKRRGVWRWKDTPLSHKLKRFPYLVRLVCLG